MHDQVLSVSELSDYINQTLEYAYPSVLVQGEISNFKINQGKWVFFDIKDSQTTLGCFMPLYQLKTPLEDGMLIKAVVRPKLTAWGKFSLTVSSLELAGEGSVKKAFELLRQKLEKEGLFATDRKRQLSRYPKRVALVTSKQAAAYNDFLAILSEQWGGLAIDHIQVQVQGSSAPDQIVEAIEYFNSSSKKYDALVVIRGGGSPEDLQAFQTESVTKAVFSSQITTVVGIGHEDDISLAELAADVRAATPTDAARLLVPSKAAVIAQLQDTVAMMAELTLKKLQAESVRVVRFQSSGKNLIGSALLELFAHNQLLDFGIDSALNAEKSNHKMLAEKLKSLSPQAVLDRGYSVVSISGKSLTSVATLHRGDSIMVQLANGALAAKVTAVQPQKKVEKYD